MTIKQFVDLAMFKFCPPKSSIFWWFKKWRKMVFLSMKKKNARLHPLCKATSFYH